MPTVAASGEKPSEADFTLPEDMLDRIEEMVEMLLTGLRDQDTVVCACLSPRVFREYPVFDVIPHSVFEPMSYRIGVK